MPWIRRVGPRKVFETVCYKMHDGTKDVLNVEYKDPHKYGRPYASELHNVPHSYCKGLGFESHPSNMPVIFFLTTRKVLELQGLRVRVPTM